MKTISILSASLLALTLYAFSPKPIERAPNPSVVIEMVQANSALIETNNEIIKNHMGQQAIHQYRIDSIAAASSNKALVQK